ncbi:hypothetical protein SERLA73DRAFT_53440 [Serpula lacrymans var. lacrymans S7.3]|uniref:YCII-related domain-containing protein n=2 Tax=Serpula lacrymans var. lacrymans TaxID=341189 RepID=F8PTZ9_SERL3|nr:uncharacterized protein SERLADRAFT_386716 [Serpula lacrymans var. lacrymans S7.9]EGN99624.1 hypothetical protein SERLA73DRAFT_53440 [Serpula lacrymans var. lacrymans S7.3]EGO25189.1 hypothetical protein SERLADRAFT_386716 [Serpula lacrymans var. lacrymans S7.9]
MSTTSDSPSGSKTYKFMVWAPDYTDQEALSRRLSVRSRHLEGARNLIGQGIIKVAGGLLTPESLEAEAANQKLVGSALIYEAESLAAARKLVEEDIYYKSNVWDKEKLVILPINMATPLP